MNYDFPIFKRLSSNDTGAASGHQGGIVIPKDLADYFPDLIGTISADNPTLDCHVDALLSVQGTAVGQVSTRYQIQTWGGTRSPEHRLTSNLGPIRDLATGGDYLIIERELDDFSRMRLTLVRKDTQEYERLRQKVGNKRWGPISQDEAPLRNQEIVQALDEELVREESEFTLLDVVSRFNETRNQRIARDRAFRGRILGLYENRCAFTGRSIVSPHGLIGIDAAHIVPLQAGGVDDVRNGIALSMELHWALDKGLLGVSDERTILVPAVIRNSADNVYLADLHGRTIREAGEPELKVNAQAFEWHRENILVTSNS